MNTGEIIGIVIVVFVAIALLVGILILLFRRKGRLFNRSTGGTYVEPIRDVVAELERMANSYETSRMLDVIDSKNIPTDFDGDEPIFRMFIIGIIAVALLNAYFYYANGQPNENNTDHMDSVFTEIERLSRALSNDSDEPSTYLARLVTGNINVIEDNIFRIDENTIHEQTRMLCALYQKAVREERIWATALSDPVIQDDEESLTLFELLIKVRENAFSRGVSIMDERANPRLCRIIGRYISDVVNYYIQLSTSNNLNQLLETEWCTLYERVSAFDKINAFLDIFMEPNINLFLSEEDTASIVNYIMNRENT